MISLKKKGLPSAGEFVVYRITKLNPNSAFAELLEYEAEGMIHISEVGRGWIQDIRNFLKVGQTGVAKVMKAEGNILLSIKRVDERRKKEKIRDFNLNQKSERMLERAAKKLGKTLENGYDEAGFAIEEKFGSLYEGFRAIAANKEKIKGIVPDEWLEPLTEIAAKGFEQKEIELKAKLFLKTYKPDGINNIKAVLKKSDADIKYIAAPEYMIKYRTKNAKKGKKEMEKILESIVEDSKKHGIEAKFEVIEK